LISARNNRIPPRRGRRLFLTALLSLLALLLCSACSVAETLLGTDESPAAAGTPAQTDLVIVTTTEQPESDETPTPEPILPTDEPTASPTPSVSTTTGRTLPDGSVYRPVLVVIDNAAQCRPQTGLMLADIVYEFPLDRADHGTRFLAVFSDEIAARVGPVCDSRAYLADTALEWDGLYVSAGDPPDGDDPYPALADAGLSAPLQNSGDAAQYFYRDITVTSTEEHTLFFKALEADGVFSTSDALTPASRFAFQSGVTYEKGKRIQSVGLPFTSSDKEKIVYTYDAASNLLLRSEKNSKGVLCVSKSLTPASNALGYESEPIAVQNLIVQYVHVSAFDTVYRSVDVTGEGACDYFINGLHVPGTWSRPSLSSTITYLLYDGTPICLEPGSTWIEMMPKTHEIRIRYES